jgi:hypothetical protein
LGKEKAQQKKQDPTESITKIGDLKKYIKASTEKVIFFFIGLPAILVVAAPIRATLYTL